MGDGGNRRALRGSNPHRQRKYVNSNMFNFKFIVLNETDLSFSFDPLLLFPEHDGGNFNLCSPNMKAETLTGTCGANGDNLTWSLDTESGVLTISGSGAKRIIVPALRSGISTVPKSKRR
jgi:hypothetical protein